MMRKRISIPVLALLFAAFPLRAEPGLSMSLSDFERFAIERGIQGALSELALQTAGYERTIAFRQTDSPSVTLSGEGGRRETETNGRSVLIDDKTATVTITQPTIVGTQITASGSYGDLDQPSGDVDLTQPLYLFTWNEGLRKRKRAELSFGSARDTFDRTVLSIRAQARRYYYDVMLGDESIAVEKRKAESSRRLLDITQALVQAGKSPAVETMRAKIRTQTDERQLQNAVTQRDKAVLNAKYYAGLPLEDPIRFTSRLEFAPFRLSVERLIDYAMLHRPELRSLRRDVQQALLNLQETKEGGRLHLAVHGGVSYQELSSVLARSWRLGGEARWLAFDSGITPSRVRQSEIAMQVAQFNLDDAERQTRLAVSNAFLDVKRAEQQIQAFEFSREQARRNVEVLRLRFKNGLDRLLDVFAAENEMRDLDNEYLGLLVSYLRAQDELSTLIGVDVRSLQ